MEEARSKESEACRESIEKRETGKEEWKHEAGRGNK